MGLFGKSKKERETEYMSRLDVPSCLKEDFELIIDDIFTIMGVGTVATGNILTGMCREGENRELIDAEVKSIKEKLATLETAAVITTTEEFHVDIREIILKLKDDTLSTLEKHTALASILDYMEYDKEKDEYSFYYKFEE